MSEKELRISEMLVERMSNEWDLSQYHDEYREPIMEWIEKKAPAGGVIPPDEMEGGDKSGKVVDMRELLKHSVRLASGKRAKEAKEIKTEEVA